MRHLKQLSTAVALGVCLVTMLAGIQILTPAPAEAVEYCTLNSFCLRPVGPVVGTCIDEGSGICLEIHQQTFGQCLWPCS